LISYTSSKIAERCSSRVSCKQRYIKYSRPLPLPLHNTQSIEGRSHTVSDVLKLEHANRDSVCCAFALHLLLLLLFSLLPKKLHKFAVPLSPIIVKSYAMHKCVRVQHAMRPRQVGSQQRIICLVCTYLSLVVGRVGVHSSLACRPRHLRDAIGHVISGPTAPSATALRQWRTVLATVHYHGTKRLHRSRAPYNPDWTPR